MAEMLLYKHLTLAQLVVENMNCAQPNNSKRKKGEKEMAKNWTMAEAAKVVARGTDKGALQDLASRFPLLALALAKGDFATLMGAIPEKITARIIENALKEGIKESDAEDEDETEEATEAEEMGEAEADEDLSSLTGKELYARCIKAGIKVSKYGKSKADYIALLTASNEPDEEEDAEEDEDEDDYAGMSAKELYDACKKAGLKVKAKMDKKTYIEALEALKEATEDDDEDDNDGWEDDDEDEEPVKAPKKNAKKTSAKTSKSTKKTTKSKKVVEEEEDDDDDDAEDWNI